WAICGRISLAWPGTRHRITAADRLPARRYPPRGPSLHPRLGIGATSRVLSRFDLDPGNSSFPRFHFELGGKDGRPSPGGFMGPGPVGFFWSGGPGSVIFADPHPMAASTTAATHAQAARRMAILPTGSQRNSTLPVRAEDVTVVGRDGGPPGGPA